MRKKESSPIKSDKSIHRLRDEPERQLGSLRGVIGNIRHDGGMPSVESIATELSGMHTAQRAPVLLALQSTHGNQYVQRVVTGIQAKLKIGQPGDIYEQEADRVADEVMRMPEPEMQRQAEEGEGEEEKLQTKPLARRITPLMQRQPIEEEEEEIQANGYPSPTSDMEMDLESRINSMRGGGHPLPSSTRRFFEQRFGYDFGGVHTHTDSHTAELAREINARSFTIGHDIAFGAGQYSPSTEEGRKLLAHELTHVIQQGGSAGNARTGDLKISPGNHTGRFPTVQRDMPTDVEVEGSMIRAGVQPRFPSIYGQLMDAATNRRNLSYDDWRRVTRSQSEAMQLFGQVLNQAWGVVQGEFLNYLIGRVASATVGAAITIISVADQLIEEASWRRSREYRVRQIYLWLLRQLALRMASAQRGRQVTGWDSGVQSIHQSLITQTINLRRWDESAEAHEFHRRGSEARGVEPGVSYMSSGTP